MKRFLIRLTFVFVPLIIPIGYYLIFLHPQLQRLADMGTYNLSSLGYILFDDEYNKSVVENYPEEKQWLVSDYEENFSCSSNSRILTIGDSFSQPRIGAYSNYLAHIVSFQVENLPRIGSNMWNPFKRFWELFAYGQNMPDVVVVESVERTLVNRLLDLDFNKKEQTRFDVENADIKKGIKQNELQRLSKRTIDYYRNIFTKETKRSVRHQKLSKEMFSCKGFETDFYFYEQEVTITNTIDEIEIASQKMDSLFMFAKERGITLIILVAADAYDVYQSYIVDNPYPAKTVLDDLYLRVRNPGYIDTKKLFMPYVEQGVKDIYWCSDTHWSPVGAKIVAEEIARRLDSMGVCKDSILQ